MPITTTTYFVRHATSVANNCEEDLRKSAVRNEQLYYEMPSWIIPLHRGGYAEAERAAQKLLKYQPRGRFLLLSSPFARCIDTAVKMKETIKTSSGHNKVFGPVSCPAMTEFNSGSEDFKPDNSKSSDDPRSDARLIRATYCEPKNRDALGKETDELGVPANILSASVFPKAPFGEGRGSFVDGESVDDVTRRVRKFLRTLVQFQKSHDFSLFGISSAGSKYLRSFCGGMKDKQKMFVVCVSHGIILNLTLRGMGIIKPGTFEDMPRLPNTEPIPVKLHRESFYLDSKKVRIVKDPRAEKKGRPNIEAVR